MLPCEWGQAGKQVLGNCLPGVAQSIDDAAGIDRVPVYDGGDDQIECRCPDGQVFLAAITEAAETVKIDGAHQTVAAFALIQFDGRGFAQLFVVDPVEGKEGRSIRPIWRSAWARPFCLVVADNRFSMSEALTVRVRSEVMMRRMSSQCARIRSASIRSPMTF